MPRRYRPKKVLVFSWSPQLAYVVGLIATDGCLSSNRKNVIFTSRDIEQIGNMKLILNLCAKIGFTRNSRSEAYRLQFSSVQLWDWLFSLGLTPNKSLTIGELRIPDEYFIDFLRGHLDGDGSITAFTDRYNARKNPKYVYERIYLRFISASKAHIEWLHRKMVELCGVHGAVHITKITKAGQNPIHIIKFGKKESLRLLSQIYYADDIPCLSRKRSVYKEFLCRTNQLQNKK